MIYVPLISLVVFSFGVGEDGNGGGQRASLRTTDKGAAGLACFCYTEFTRVGEGKREVLCAEPTPRSQNEKKIFPAKSL